MSTTPPPGDQPAASPAPRPICPDGFHPVVVFVPHVVTDRSAQNFVDLGMQVHALVTGERQTLILHPVIAQRNSVANPAGPEGDKSLPKQIVGIGSFGAYIANQKEHEALIGLADKFTRANLSKIRAKGLAPADQLSANIVADRVKEQAIAQSKTGLILPPGTKV